jgi:hypothetical protein
VSEYILLISGKRNARRVPGIFSLKLSRPDSISARFIFFYFFELEFIFQVKIYQRLVIFGGKIIVP